MSSRNASSDRRTTGPSVWSHKGQLSRALGNVTTKIQNFVFPVQGRILFEQAIQCACDFSSDLNFLFLLHNGLEQSHNCMILGKKILILFSNKFDSKSPPFKLHMSLYVQFTLPAHNIIIFLFTFNKSEDCMMQV
jgi:hypothetical protein